MHQYAQEKYPHTNAHADERDSFVYVRPSFRPCIHMFSIETSSSLSRQPCISSKLQLSYYHMQISEHWLRYVHVFLVLRHRRRLLFMYVTPKALKHLLWALFSLRR